MLTAFTKQLPRLRAEEALELASVVMLPHLKESDRRRFLRRLDRAAQRRPAKAPIEVLENDPEKAAAWFARQGARVVVKHG